MMDRLAIRTISEEVSLDCEKERSIFDCETKTAIQLHDSLASDVKPGRNSPLLDRC